MIDLNALKLDQLASELQIDSAAKRLADSAFEEDTRWNNSSGDITSIATEADSNKQIRATVVSRQQAIVSGTGVVRTMLDTFEGEGVSLQIITPDGTSIEQGTPCLELTGNAAVILRFERTLLNMLSHLFGIATTTSTFVRAASTGNDQVKVLDTRKTLPGYRMLCKYAVRCGGGWLHRVNLADAVLIKDNHIASIPDQEVGHFVKQASQRARSNREIRFLEVEVDRLSQLRSIIDHASEETDYVLLDNMPNQTMAEAVQMRNSARASIQLEASGGMTLERMASVAQTGVERISVGGITQRSTTIDLGLDIR